MKGCYAVGFLVLFSELLVLISACGGGPLRWDINKELPSYWEGASLPKPKFNWRHHQFHDMQLKYIMSRMDATKLEVHKQWGGLLSRNEKLKKPNNETCLICQTAAEAALKAYDNSTKRSEMEKTIFAICKDVYKNSTIDDLGCDAFANVFMLVAELLIHRYHFDVPNIVCADMLKQCIEPCCSATAPFQPQQLHLSFATEVAVAPVVSMRVAWTTLQNAPDASVWFRLLPHGEWQQSDPKETQRRTYTLGGWVGMLYSAVMSNLTANSVYEYYVGSTSKDADQLSKHYNFSTLPVDAGTKRRPLRVLGVADMGFGTNAQPSIQRMKEYAESGAIDFIVHPGDIGYADGNQMWWDIFMREMEPIMARVPYMTGPGNHECFFWNCTAYRHRMWMPAPEQFQQPIPEGALFYKLQAGPVTFYMLDSESAYDTPKIGDIQKNWISDVFSKEDAKKAEERTFKFVMQHRPLYCDSGTDVLTSPDCNEFALFLRLEIEGLFHQHRVPMVMVGHIHNYQRTYPVYAGEVAQKNYINISEPMYLVNGGAGNREGNGQFSDANHTMPWYAYRTRERTFMLYDIFGEMEESGKKVTVNAKTIRSIRGDVVDSFQVTQYV